MSTTENYLKGLSVMTEDQKEQLNTNGTVSITKETTGADGNVTSNQITVNLENRVIYGVVNNKMPPLREPEITPSEDSVVTYGPNGQGVKSLSELRQVTIIEINQLSDLTGENMTSYSNTLISNFKNNIETEILLKGTGMSTSNFTYKCCGVYESMGTHNFNYIGIGAFGQTEHLIINISALSNVIDYTSETIKPTKLYRHNVCYQCIDGAYEYDVTFSFYSKQNIHFSTNEALDMLCGSEGGSYHGGFIVTIIDNNSYTAVGPGLNCYITKMLIDDSTTYTLHFDSLINNTITSTSISSDNLSILSYSVQEVI